MNRTWNRAALLLSVLALAACGCQNVVKVRVERVLIEPELHLRYDSLLGRKLDLARKSLDLYLENVKDVNDEKSFRPTTVPSDLSFWKIPFEIDAAGGKLLAAFLYESLPKWEKSAEELLKECEAYFTKLDITPHVRDARETVDKVDNFFARRKKELQELAENLGEGAIIPKTISDLRETVATRVDSKGSSFGGFVHTDVYVINPSDPRYAEILKSASPIWSVIKAPFWRHESLQALTEVTVGVTGDSGIMVVFEHPGQVRVYQVSMDPTQITSNIALLMAKGSSAAAKFLSSGLAP